MTWLQCDQLGRMARGSVWLPPTLSIIAVLERAAQRMFPDDEDRARAAVGDLQGIGGSTSSASLGDHQEDEVARGALATCAQFATTREGK